MAGEQEIAVHVVANSHPCLAVTTALDRYGLAYETVELVSGTHGDELEKIYGEGKRTVPGMVVGGEPVHGTPAVFARIDQLAAEADLYPAEIEEQIREVEEGLAEDLQSAGRHLIWGALHFRPEAMGTFAGAGTLDPAGTDFAIKFLRGAWRYTGVTAEVIAERLSLLPGQLDHVDDLIAKGVIGRDEPTAVDFQIGSSLHVLIRIGDLEPLIDGRPAMQLVTDHFEPGQGRVPAGALPPGWVHAL